MASSCLLFLYNESAGDLWVDYAKTLLVLAGICMLAMGTARVVLPRLRTRLSGVGPIRVLASHPLEPKKTLYVVRAGNTSVLLGTSGTAVHFIAKLEDADFSAEPPGETQPRAAQSMLRTMAQVVQKRSARPSL